jgi:penicillin-binding protein 2
MSSPEETGFQVRLTVLIVVVACLFAALFARLWFLQVINAPKAQAVAQTNGVQVFYTPARRGEILDDKGRVLVGNVAVPVIEVDQQTAAGDPTMVSNLAALLGMTVKQLNTAINNVQYSPYAPVPVMPDASPAQILEVQENPSMFPGVHATSEWISTYSNLGKAAGNIVGYVGQITSADLTRLKGLGYQPGDEIGLTGIELEYESYLRGVPGQTKVQVDSQGNVLTTISSTPPVPGYNIRLSIDGLVQQTAVKALQQGMLSARTSYDKVTNKLFEAPDGAAVVEDPQNGQIIALATSPFYDPSWWVGGISQAHYNQLRNNHADPQDDRSIDGVFPPGSTFKLITAMAGLQSGIINPYTPFDDTGHTHVGTTPIHNDNGDAYGVIDLSEAITYSSDLYFDAIGLDLWYERNKFGPDYLQNTAAEFGLGRPTGIDLPGEASGKIPTPASYAKDHAEYPLDYPQGQWLPGDSYQVAIGQDEDLVTPLQLANAYSAFANGGTLFAPRLAEDAETGSGKIVKQFIAPVKNHISIQPVWRQNLLQGFEGVVQNGEGTAHGDFARTPLISSAYDLAGKTGTAQVNAPRQNDSVFVSFSPATQPKYVVDAIVEDAGYGASVAAPVVREIYDQLYGLPLQPALVTGVSGSGGQN